MKEWYQITPPRRGVCAGIALDYGVVEMDSNGELTRKIRVVETAPYFRYMIGWEMYTVREHVSDEDGKIELVP